MTNRNAIAREIIGTSLYIVLDTADQDGTPWACPVYFAHVDYRFLWISRAVVEAVSGTFSARKSSACASRIAS